MASSETLIDGVEDIGGSDALSLSDLVTLKLKGGRTVFLDGRNPGTRLRVEVLQSFRKSGHFIYLKFDSETNNLLDLLLPSPELVTSLESIPENGDTRVEFDLSSAIHWLRKDSPQYQDILLKLKLSMETMTPIFITETLDSHEIVDARPIPFPPNSLTGKGGRNA